MGRFRLNTIIIGLVFIGVFTCGTVVDTGPLQVGGFVLVSFETSEKSLNVCEKERRNLVFSFQFPFFSRLVSKIFSSYPELKIDLFEHISLSRAPPFCLFS